LGKFFVKINLMKQTIITALAVLVVLGLLAVVIMGSKNKKTGPVPVPTNQESGLVFFYGHTCPHCQEVEEWLKNNKIEDKVKIVKKEVYDNQQNAQELATAAKNCGLPTDRIGVPFLYAEGQCLIGTPEVENYLAKKAGL
jgi:glutaredoxin